MKLLILILVQVTLSFCGNRTRIGRSAVNYVWPGGIIPYQFTPEFPDNGRETFLRAIKSIEESTCIRFPQKTEDDRFWLDVRKGKCCGADFGRRPDLGGKGQGLTMSGDEFLPHFLRELGHTIGFPHEQDRADRDEYIYWDKTKNDWCEERDFSGKSNDLDQAALDLPFDYVSLMADWTECYWPQPHTPKDIPMGPGGNKDRKFSVLDIEKMNAVYDCRGCYGYRFRKISQLARSQLPVEGGYELNGNTFYICRVYHEGHLLVGKSLPDNKKCYVGYDKGEKEYNDNFSVLTNPWNDANLAWIRSSGSRPVNAIKGGRTKDRETIYIGRCLMTVGNDKTLIPGYYLESNPRELRISFGGGMTKCTDFEILVCNS